MRACSVFLPEVTSSTPGLTVASYGLSGPVDVRVNSAGSLFVTDDLNACIRKYPPNSTGSTPGITIGSGKLSSPVALSLDSSGNIYVSNAALQAVFWFPYNGTQLAVARQVAGSVYPGSGFNQLNTPLGVFADNSGNIFIADEYNNRIQEWVQGYPYNYYIPNTDGDYTATYVASSGCVSVASPSVAVTKPEIPVLTLNGLDTLSTTSYQNYEWLYNGVVLSNANQQTYVAQNPGNYTVIVTNANGCADTSAAYNVTLTAINTVGENSLIQVYPNPNNGDFMFKSANQWQADACEIYNITGTLVKRIPLISNAQLIHLSDLAAGNYCLKLLGNQPAAIQFSVVK